MSWFLSSWFNNDTTNKTTEGESQEPPKILQIRVGGLQPAETYQDKLGSWPEKIPSAFFKEPVQEVNVTLNGLEGNEIGHPIHIANGAFRHALVYNLSTHKLFKSNFPDHEIKIGDFGENFVVDHPALSPDVICIGDKFQIGTAIFQVTGPRKPCPKIDAAQKQQGIQKCAIEHGWAGYFFRVLQEGKVSVGDSILLLERPFPGFTIDRISQGLWGPPEQQDNSLEFLTTLANMEPLIPRGYRETAQSRLERLSANN